MPTNRRLVTEMSASGLDQSEIGRILGVSRERVRQILNPKQNQKSRPPIPDQPLTTGDAARMLNVHTNTIRRWSRAGILKPYRIGPRGDRRFLRADVAKVLRKSGEWNDLA